ncbi:hypothetical protein FRC04_003917 [Tulasnella sp. 424]|nr:hypothetical protein FRC04_003917 [Tulasnella sp. 424]KAG8964672.1 hypothetical protein FRC05_003631 [Tulasnella sp. 425]
MIDTQFQSSEWMSGLNRKDKNKVLKQCERTILCIPSEERKPLTEKEVVVALGVRRAVVFYDEQTNGYWVRGSDEEYRLFLERLSERGLPGYTTREVDWEGREGERLAQKLVYDMRLQTGGGPSQSQKSIEQRAEASSTSLLIQAAKNNDTEIGKSLDLPVDTTPDASGSGSVSPPSSPRETSSQTGYTHDNARTPTEEVLDKHRPKKARHKQNEGVKGNTASSLNKSTSQPSTPYLDIAFAKFSPELVSYIFKLCLEDVTSSEEHNHILEKLASHEGHCLEVLENASSLWTKITSTSPEVHIKKALDLSKQRPLHIEAGPKPSSSAALNVTLLTTFILHIDHHRARWASLELLFPSSMLKRVKKHLAHPAPCLETLSLSMADAALETGLALPVDDSTLRGEIGTPLDILGRKAGKLERVTLNNIPCLWDPTPFVNVIDISLSNGIHLRYTDLILFFRHSTLLRSLHLINIKIVGEVPRVVEQVIPLPNLVEIVLVELIEPMGLGSLYLSLDAPSCDLLHLDLRPSMTFLNHPALEERAAPTVQKALASNSTSYLLFRSNANTQSASWQSEEEVARKGRDGRPAFNICLRSTDTRLASLFCAFVRGVQTYVNVGNIVVDVGDSVSGAIVEPFGLDLDDIVPTLFPESFQGINVVELRAEIVDGYLQHLKEMVASEGSEVQWCFGSLQTLRLRAIPEVELEVIPDESARCNVESLVSHISEKRYGAANVPHGEGLGMSLALHGLFMIETATGQHLENEDTLHGIAIDHSAAVLIYHREEEAD